MTGGRAAPLTGILISRSEVSLRHRFGSSFLEEAFGGLVREEGMTKEYLDGHLVLSTTEPDLEDDVELAKNSIAHAADTGR